MGVSDHLVNPVTAAASFHRIGRILHIWFGWRIKSAWSGRRNGVKGRHIAIVAGLSLLASPASGQQAGWHYSPLPGEGDRAALGCALGSTPNVHACLAVRCEDDFSRGVHIMTSRKGGDAGAWAITIDKQTRAVEAVAGEPYGARIVTGIDWLLDNLAHGAVSYLEPESGPPMPVNHIALDGSLRAITQALAYCAPRRPAESEPQAGNGV